MCDGAPRRPRRRLHALQPRWVVSGAGTAGVWCRWRAIPPPKLKTWRDHRSASPLRPHAITQAAPARQEQKGDPRRARQLPPPAAGAARRRRHQPVAIPLGASLSTASLLPRLPPRAPCCSGPQTLSKEEMSRTVRAVLLAGGETKNPLTRHRAMPAVPLGSSLLMVDVPLNNCLQAGINKM